MVFRYAYRGDYKIKYKYAGTDSKKEIELITFGSIIDIDILPWICNSSLDVTSVLRDVLLLP